MSDYEINVSEEIQKAIEGGDIDTIVDSFLLREDVANRLRQALSFVVERRSQFLKFLVWAYQKTSYFTAPASPKYHNNFEYGLIDHSLNVASNLLKVNKTLGGGYSSESCVIVALAHDFGKSGEVNNPYYTINEPTDNQKKYGYVAWPPYSYNKPRVYMSVPQRSLFYLTKFVDLMDYEYQAILIHDGQYVDDNKSYAAKECRLALLIQYADNWAGFTMESTFTRATDSKGYVEVKPDKV